MVGARIKVYLEQNGIKQAFVCDKTGIAPARLSQMLNSGARIDCITYYKICKALNQPYEAFLEGNELGHFYEGA